MESIGKEIRAILKKKGLSVNKAANDLGVAQESLHRSLRDGSNPQWKTIRAVLDYLDYECFLRPKRKLKRKV